MKKVRHIASIVFCTLLLGGMGWYVWSLEPYMSVPDPIGSWLMPFKLFSTLLILLLGFITITDDLDKLRNL